MRRESVVVGGWAVEGEDVHQRNAFEAAFYYAHGVNFAYRGPVAAVVASAKV